jgi:hypothetical protein
MVRESPYGQQQQQQQQRQGLWSPYRPQPLAALSKASSGVSHTRRVLWQHEMLVGCQGRVCEVELCDQLLLVHVYIWGCFLQQQCWCLLLLKSSSCRCLLCKASVWLRDHLHELQHAVHTGYTSTLNCVGEL